MSRVSSTFASEAIPVMPSAMPHSSEIGRPTIGAAIRVLIIDADAPMRAVMEKRLGGRSGIEVVGTARNDAEAREHIRTLMPDVIVLDIETPELNGLEIIEKIMRLRPTPVIVTASLDREGSDLATRAITLGAVDCYAKTGDAGASHDDGGRLAHLVRQAAKAGPRRHA